MFEKFRFAYFTILGLAAVEIVVGISLGQSDFWHFIRSKGLRQLVVATGFLFPLIWISGVSFAVVRRQIERPSKAIWRMIRRQRVWLLRGALFAVMIVLFARSFSSFKSSMYRFNPFWADPWLVELDRMTFGTDPWRWTHALIGPVGTVVLDRIYILWFLMMFLTLGWLCFTQNQKLQIRGLLSYLLSWGLLGGVAAVSMSSVGPCFYDQFYGERVFAPLMANLEAVHGENKLYAFRTMQFLLESLGKDQFGSGISAMPSLHVTIAMLSFLAVYNYAASRLLKLISGLFALAIFVGSVHLGWHYAWDGIFGIAGVMIFWWGSGKLVDWNEARENRQASTLATTPLPAMS